MTQVTGTEAAGWAQGLDEVLARIAGRFGRADAGAQRRICAGFWRRWSARTAGNWLRRLAMRARTAFRSF